MALGNYALYVYIQGAYPELSGIDFVYDVGDVINLIYIDPIVSDYPIPDGVSLEVITDALNQAYANTLAKIPAEIIP